MLACPARLPKLAVNLFFQLHTDTELDLSWLRQQPCSSLTIQVYVGTDEPTVQHMLVDELRQLPVDVLIVDFADGLSLSSDIQILYQQLSISTEYTLRVGSEAFGNASQALQALPHSPKIRITFDGEASRPRYVSWSAVSSQAAKVMINMRGQTLHMVGHHHADYDAPWQLFIEQAEQVCGLHGAHAHDKVFVNQDQSMQF